MTLATRCTACGTSFRVVQDQLKVSGGWVRCGRCNEVFNALDGLYEIFTQQVEGPAPSPPPAHRATTDATTTYRLAGTGGVAQLPPPAPRIPDASTAGTGHGEPAEPSVDIAFDGGPLPAGPSSSGVTGAERSTPGFEDAETRLEPRTGEDLVPTPSFMRPGRDPAPATTARRRVLQASAVGALVLTLCLQLGFAWRDSLAAHAPALAPMLESACAIVGCRIEAPRNLAALAVEGSNLRQRNGEGAYELAVALRNRSASAVRVPAFELTLIDSQGKSLIRRVLTPGDMGAAEERLPAGTEWNLQAALQVDDRRIAGYTVEIFYP